jgi:diguanylate cyclase (GGDEF)-like protein/PAS domain S-box-containing protein
LARLAEAEDTLRAIGAGEVDAFVVSDGGSGRRVFTLSTADRPYRMFVEQMREGAATVSASGLILYANPRLAELLSYSRATIVGAPLSHFISDAAALAGADADGQPALGAVLECDLLGRDGKIVPVLVGSSVLEVDGDRLSCLTFTDMTAHKAQERAISRLSDDRAIRMAELQQAQAALTALATHDGLTGLPNRALLVDRIDQALFRARRLSSSTALLFIDLDRFKQINDMQGHAAGDEVLRSVGDRLVGALRPMDTVARIGGDEFVVLAPEIESEMRAMDLSARLLAELDRRDAHVGHGLSCSASVGIAISVGGRGDGETLLSEADTAMYRAKSRGGGRAELFDAALGREVQKRSAAQRTIEAALDEQRIKVHYQPVVAVSTGRLDGFEALARIAKRDGNLLGPADFIPVAEETGLVVPLGTRVLELACQQAKRWAPDGLARRDATVAVNLSARQFATGELPGVVRRTLQHTGLDPSRLHLELTETAIMGLHPDILKQLASISDLGVQLGLDDFGTGYASLAHLRRLPLTFVKIDQTFVTGLGVDHEDERIVAAVVDLAANLGLRSIAEGIESVAQLDRLREFGCDQAQGYLFARPLPPDGVATYMELPPP